MRSHTQYIDPLDASILRTLSRRDLRAYRIVQFLQQSPGNHFLPEEGALYPALQRLELNGWIAGTWGMTPDYRRARIYRITSAGREHLENLARCSYGLRVANLPFANCEVVKSFLLFGCVATGAAFGQTPHLPSSGGISVNVCMAPNQNLRISTRQAQSLVSAIFSEIAVNLTWQNALADCSPSAIKIRWAQHAPSKSAAGALAGARPFDSSDASITIYEVPLHRFLSRFSNAPETVLAYVLAHELAHVMQGLDHRSGSGILKTNWSYREYCSMLARTLSFTAKDVELIRMGLEARTLRITTELPSMTAGFDE